MGERREFFKPSEIAPQLGITTGSVYQMIRAGEIPAIRGGGSIRIPRRGFDAWLSEQSKRALVVTRAPESAGANR